MGNEKKQSGLKKVKEIIELMIDNDLVEVEISEGDSKIHLKRPGHSAPAIMQAAPAYAPVAAAAETPAAEEYSGLANIDSPMVGTFYSAASPDAPAYVKPGDSVTEDTVICIVEAMKVMNEIKAEVAGTIEKVLVSNGQAVEFGQAIFKVRPL